MSTKQRVTEAEARKNLARLRALSQQLACAISAIENNNLEELQNSIASQELLCCELTGAEWPNSPAGLEPSLTDEIRSAQIELAQQNRIYARVLKHAQRSAALMTALYRSFGEGYAKDAPPPAENKTLSCEA